MSEQIYEAPSADLGDEDAGIVDEFYVVSKKKFIVLYLATMGIYSVYWVYKNWRCYKTVWRTDIWPVPRAIFQIFYMHSLFAKIDETLGRKKIEYSWSPSTLATGYVVLSILSQVLDRLSAKEIGSPITDLLSFGILPLLMLILMQAQAAINLSQDDEFGSRNSQFSVANWLWILLGVIFWAFVGIGLLMIFGVVAA